MTKLRVTPIITQYKNNEIKFRFYTSNGKGVPLEAVKRKTNETGVRFYAIFGKENNVEEAKTQGIV